MFDFIALLRQFHIPYLDSPVDKHYRFGWLQIHCPFCDNNRKKWHMGYNLDNCYFNCWNCGFSPIKPVVFSLFPAEAAHAVLDSFRERTYKTDHYTKFVQGKLEIPLGMVDGLPFQHREYLLTRRLDPDIVQKTWGLQAFRNHTKYPWRIFVPIMDKAGETVSWTTRSIAEVKYPYIVADKKQEKIFHKNLLYGEQYATDTIIICEGIVDVWKIGKGAVCTFGKEYSKSQLNRMLSYPKRIVLFDNDADNDGYKLACELSAFPGETFQVKIDASDPGDADVKEITELRKEFNLPD